MGRLVGEFDWSAGPLGAMQSWPQSLRTSVDICLTSRFPIVLWWGPQLVMIYNDGYRPMLGFTKHPQALGSPGRQIWPEIWHVIGPMLEGVMAGQGATWSDDQLLLLDRNGFLEECYFTYSYSPITEESGAVGGVFCAVTETTAKVVGARRLETLGTLAAQLVDSDTVEEVCRRTVKVLSDNVEDVRFAELYLPRAGGFTRAAGHGSLARKGSWPLAQVSASGLGVVVPLDPSPLAAAAPGAPAAYVLPVCEPGESSPCAVLLVGLSERRPFDAGYKSFLDLIAGHVGTAIGGAGAFQRQRERAQALAELDAAKTTFFSNMSHELRTPLTLIAGPVSDALADTAQPLPPAQRERLLLVARNASRLHRLVNGMLDFARIEAGRLVPERVAVDLSQATAELAANFSDVMHRAGLQFAVQVEQLPRPVMVDRDMWERIVLNLLSNALKYTLQGRVGLALRETVGQVELTVTDTGVGIAARDLPHLFDRFHRVPGARGRSHEGSGIGLAMVAELLKLLGGKISVDSTAGQGSTFTVRLPYGKAATAGLAPRSASHDAAAPFVEEAMSWAAEPGIPAARGGTGRPRLLMADDNQDLRNYLAGLLSGHYDVEMAVDGEQALRAIAESKPDLVLADVMMPRLDGFGLLAAIRADPGLRDLPVVLLSARAGEEAAAEGFAAGADDYLVKPFSAQDLKTRLQAALTRATARTRDGRELRHRQEAAARLVALLGTDLAEAELRAAVVVGFGEIFGGEVVLDPEQVPASWPEPLGAMHPGLLIEVPGERVKSVWVRFPAARQISPDERVLAAALADTFATGLARAGRESSRHLTEQHLRQAIESHRYIGQAVGILMERHRLTAAVAFERLRQASRDRNLKLREVAEKVISTGEDPAPPGR